MICPAPARFDVRTQRKTFGELADADAALGAPYDDDTFGLLHSASADAPWWRVVELSSDDGLPFRAKLSWWGGTSPVGAEVRLSVSRRARVCLYAKRIDIHMQNLASDANDLRAFIQDTPVAIPTRNALEVWFDGSGDGGVFLDVPPFAHSVRVDRNALGDGDGFFLLARPPAPAADPSVAPVGFGATALSLNPSLHPGVVPVQGAAAVQIVTAQAGRVAFELDI